MKPLSEHPAIEQLKTVYNLDSPGVDIIKTIGSTFFANLSRHSHVHELLWLKINDQHFLAKSEDVYLSMSHPHVLDYTDFYSFSISLFELGDYSTPERTFRFPEEPEIKDIIFSENEVLGKIGTIRDMKDQSSISSIQDPLIRKLFVFYLSRKEKLIDINGKPHENVFNHRGRDILNEVIASSLAKFLQIKVPNNFFGIKSMSYRLPLAGENSKIVQAVSRYVLSELLSKKLDCPSLDGVLGDVERSGYMGSEFSVRSPSCLTNANPLGIRHFSRQSTPEHLKKKKLILGNLPHYPDLVYSDFFDRLLGGWKDRKLQEYLLPKGPYGPIYTVDYGEILFPELEFEKDDPHYRHQRDQHITSFLNYLDGVASLAGGNIYKALIFQPVFLFTMLPRGLFKNLVSNIPSLYFSSHWDDMRYAYNPETLIDFFEYLKNAVKGWLVDSEEADPNHLYCTAERIFS
ncbi:MAG: hypothetical protein GY807_23585 [Gammaproteobacteria bacterium]|nr:hypothetical protein [Gammaproteobacteria bacterium]